MSNQLEDETSIKGTRLLSDIYEICNVTISEPVNYKETIKNCLDRCLKSKEERRKLKNQ